MLWYIVLSACLLFALSACLVLALRMKKERKASQFAISAFRENHEVRLPVSSPPVKIQAVMCLPSGTPEKIVEEQLAHKLASCLPSFWRLEKRYDYDVEYRASVYVCKMEDAMP